MKTNTRIILLSLLIITPNIHAAPKHKKVDPAPSQPTPPAAPITAKEPTKQVDTQAPSTQPVQAAAIPTATPNTKPVQAVAIPSVTPDTKPAPACATSEVTQSPTDIDQRPDPITDTDEEGEVLAVERRSERNFARQSAPAQSAANTTEQQATPRLSANDIRAIEEMQQKAISINAEQQQLEEKLAADRKDGWDTATESEPASTKPVPRPQGWLDRFTGIPQEWWKEHITDKNRVEQLMRFSGMVPTYIILRQKLDTGAFGPFINDLNENAGEGNRWIDEALQQATADNQEATTRRIMKAAIPYKQALPPATRTKVADYLIKRAERKRKALAEDNEEFTSDIHELTGIIREAAEDQPGFPAIDTEILEKCAAEAALTLTKCASAGYLPRPKSAITDRK